MTDDIIPIEEARSRKAKKTTVAPQLPKKQKVERGSTQRDELIAWIRDAGRVCRPEGITTRGHSRRDGDLPPGHW